MSVTLDGNNLFDQQSLEIEIGSLVRDSMERSVSGLDGVLSIDLGERGRKIKQKGILHAKSSTQLEERIEAIGAFLDGNTHILVTKNDGSIDNIRMDVFKVDQKRTSGSGMCCNYTIVYTQLKT